jgi:hypothetical protein
MLPEQLGRRMDKNQIIALVFVGLMVTSMVAWGATAL